MSRGLGDVYKRQGLCSAMGRNDLIENPLYKTNLARCENYLTSLKPIIEEWTQTKTIKELEEIITKLAIPFGVILTIPEAAEHPQLQSRNMLWNVYQKGMDTEIRIPGTPIKIHGEEDKVQKGAPLLGEDNELVYSSLLGMTKQEIDELYVKEII